MDNYCQQNQIKYFKYIPNGSLILLVATYHRFFKMTLYSIYSTKEGMI